MIYLCPTAFGCKGVECRSQYKLSGARFMMLAHISEELNVTLPQAQVLRSQQNTILSSNLQE